MDIDEVIAALRSAAAPETAVAMQAYMRNKFVFLGIPKPQRAALIKPFLTSSKAMTPDDVVATMARLVQIPEREFHYVAIDLFEKRYKDFDRSDLDQVLPFFDISPWWESVDALRKPVGLWTRGHRDEHRGLHSQLLAGSMWQRRVAITLQLQWKSETDTELLADAIVVNLHDKEFFIQKAIGWSLREYAKTDPQWVLSFVSDKKVTGLALREATKHL